MEGSAHYNEPMDPGTGQKLKRRHPLAYLSGYATAALATANVFLDLRRRLALQECMGTFV